MPLIPKYPITRQIMLEIRARINHRINEYINSVPINLDSD